MPEDKRFYSRYNIHLEAKVGLPSGANYSVEILDLSVEGAKFKAYQDLPIKEGDKVFLLIKAQTNLKIKGEIRWIKKDEKILEFGVQFVDIDFQTREVLSSIISQHALISLGNEYFK